MTAKYVLPLIGVLGLSACGGGGGSAPIDLSAGPASFGGLVGETRRLTDRIDNEPLVAVAPASQSSDVNFDGVLLAVEAGGAARTYTGQVVVDVSLATGLLDGSANNFFENGVDGSGNPTGPAFTRGGEITLDGDTSVAGSLADTFAVTLGGTFDQDGATVGETVVGSGDAQFRGPNATTVDILVVDGTFTADSTTFSYSIATD